MPDIDVRKSTESMWSPQRTDGRWWAVLLITAYVLLLVFACGISGKARVLSVAGAVQMSEHFGDLTLFAAARQEVDRGGNPYLHNPDDPWGRPFNYPWPWLAIMRFPMNWVPVIGCGLIIAWLVSTGWWSGKLTPLQGVLAAAAVCSPPLVLAFDRGNSDLILFMLLLAALAAMNCGWRAGAWAIIFLSFVLKLFPVAGFVMFLRLGWRRAMIWLVVAGLAVAGHILREQDDIRTALHNTPTDLMMSYGAIHWTKVAEHWATELTGKNHDFSLFAGQTKLWASFVFGGAIWLGWSRRERHTQMQPEPDRFLDGFRLGACIYALTFIGGSNYVYRQMFLLLCMPWLWNAASAGGGMTRARSFALTLIFCVLWIYPYWWFPLVLGSEICTWVLLGALGCLLGATTPLFADQRTNIKPSQDAQATRSTA